jgi:hypothetical protein
MRNFTIAAAMFAVLGVAVGATLGSGAINGTLASAEDYQQSSMPIDQLTAEARNLPAQSFDAF